MGVAFLFLAITWCSLGRTVVLELLWYLPAGTVMLGGSRGTSFTSHLPKNPQLVLPPLPLDPVLGGGPSANLRSPGGLPGPGGLSGALVLGSAELHALVGCS